MSGVPPLPEGLLWLEPVGPTFPASCNSFAIVEEDGGWTWIDPGAAGDENLKKMHAELERHRLSLDKLARIVITHPHVDHLAAAGAVRTMGYRVPILCHPDAVPLARSLDTLMASFDFDLALTRFSDQRDTVARFNEALQQVIFHMNAPFIPTAPEGGLLDGSLIETGPFRWKCILSPGHCPGHLMFHEPTHGILIAGDIVGHTLAWHSPSSGGADGYYRSLDMAEALDLALLIPAHGAPSAAPADLIAKMRARLQERESRILDTLATGACAYGQVYDQVMRDVDRVRLFPMVPMLEGHLARLKEAGEIVEGDAVFSRR